MGYNAVLKDCVSTSVTSCEVPTAFLSSVRPDWGLSVPEVPGYPAVEGEVEEALKTLGFQHTVANGIVNQIADGT